MYYDKIVVVLVNPAWSVKIVIEYKRDHLGKYGGNTVHPKHYNIYNHYAKIKTKGHQRNERFVKDLGDMIWYSNIGKNFKIKFNDVDVKV